MKDINERIELLIAEMNEICKIEKLTYNDLIDYNLTKGKILELFLNAFSEMYRFQIGKDKIAK